MLYMEKHKLQSYYNKRPNIRIQSTYTLYHLKYVSEVINFMQETKEANLVLLPTEKRPVLRKR